MEFNWQWLLFGLPAMFALGWIAARLDGWQLRREQHESPRSYTRGLALLLAEQHDKAIDAFIEVVQDDPDTRDLHFALGDLFRKRGEFERAVRVHQHLLSRGDLKADDRERAQHALAQDYLKAGLFDRAEAALRALQGSRYASDALLALLDLHERTRDWRAAMRAAEQLEQAGVGSFAQRKSHFCCELAEEAMHAGEQAAAWQSIAEARALAPQAPRPLLLTAQWRAKAGDSRAAWEALETLRETDAAQFQRVALAYAELAKLLGQKDHCRHTLRAQYEALPTLDTLAAMAALDDQPLDARPELAEHLRQHPTLSAALAAMRELIAARLPEAPAGADVNDAKPGADSLPGQRERLRELSLAITDAVAQAAKRQQRYRCLACGFESQRYVWQCPGCLSWDTTPALRIEEQ